MKTDLLFFVNSILFGIGLAMDAFSVSVANGLNEPDMKKNKAAAIAVTFGVFQFAMPLIGWICVHTILNLFSELSKFIPWIALILLTYIGGKMIYEGIKGSSEQGSTRLTFKALIIQGIATSIDALSVGFTISDYSFGPALLESLIIGLTTSVICMLGLRIGRIAGSKLTGKANIVGGIILILIGVEIFIKGLL